MENLLYDGLFISLSTLSITFILDVISVYYVTNLLKTSSGRKLYLNSIIMNIFNNLILGTLAYIVFVNYFENTNEKSIFGMIMDCLCLLLIQSLGYYYVHILMHTKRFYFIHKFHHQYADIVIPMSANSVSILEYLLAYLTPFILGIIIVQPNRLPLKVAICMVSYCNLLIHTPWLEDVSKKYLPKFMVTTSDHLEHHLKSKTKYAAPIINWDYINELF